MNSPRPPATAGLTGPNLMHGALIERIRNLPFGGEIRVLTGQAVRPETVVAELNPGGYLHFINVAKELDLPFHLAAEAVLKSEGDTVRRSEVIATRPAALGLLVAECRAPADGVVERIYPSGHVTVRSHPVPVAASVSGTVVAAVAGEHVSILTRGTLVQGVFGLGGEGYGPLHVLPRTAGSQAAAPPAAASIPAGAVVVTPAPATTALVEQCVRAGATAMVAPTCHLGVLETLGCAFGPANPDPFGRHTRVPLILILTDGFGARPMSEALYETLASETGRDASVSGFTQLRAGVERPEMIIPAGPLPPGRPPGARSVRVGRHTLVYLDGAYTLPTLAAGVRVTLLARPHLGAEGEIEDLPREPGRLASGVVLPVAVVRLDDGRRVTVARTNLRATDGGGPPVHGRRGTAS